MKVLILFFAFFLGFEGALKQEKKESVKSPKQIIEEQYNWIKKKCEEVKDINKLRKLIEEKMNDYVDYEEFSRMTLKKYWKKLSDKEKKEFIESYKKLIQRTYTKRFKNDKPFTIEYKGEVKYNKTKTRAKVKTVIHYGESEVEVSYLLVKKNNAWKVYDLIIDDVSIVRNYRPSFYKIYKEKGFQELIRKINEKSEKEKGDE